MLRVDHVGGYLPYDMTLTQIPSTLLINTKMYLPGAVIMIYPGPALNPVEERTVKASTAAARARSLYKTLVTPKGGWGNPPVADAPTAKIMVTVDGKTRSAAIPALGITATGPNLNATQVTARTKVQNALNAINGLTGTSQLYKPRQIEAWVLDTEVNALEEDIPQPTLPWPTGVTVKVGCNPMATSQLPSAANSASRFQVGDKVFRAVFRPVLPLERVCTPR